MAIVENLKVNVDVDGGAKSLKQLKAEFKETQTALEGLDASSKEYTATLKKLANTKDEIEDLNDAIKSQMGAGKFEAFSKVGSSIASGFAAATGAAALFGAKSEEVEQALLRVQAAMAFADGLRGLEGLADAFKNAKTVAVDFGRSAVDALKGMKVGIAATGIGLLVIAVGALVAYWDDVKNFFNQFTDAGQSILKVKTQLNEASIEGAKNSAVEKTNLDNLYRASTDQNTSLKDRKEAQLELQKTYPLTFKNFTDEDFALGKAKIGYDNLTQSIIDASMVKAKQAILDKNSMAFAEEEQKLLNEIRDESAAALKQDSEDKKVYDELGNVRSVRNDKAIALRQVENLKASLEAKRAAFAAENDLFIQSIKVSQEGAKLAEAERAEVAKIDAARKKKEAEDAAAAAKRAAEAAVEAAFKAKHKEWEAIGISDIEGIAATDSLLKIQNDGRLKDAQETSDAIIEMKIVEVATYGKLTDEEIATEKAKRQAAALAATNLALESTKQLNDGLQSMSDIYFTNKLSGLKKGSKEEEAMLRKQFEVNKKLQISSAVITGIQNGITAYGAGLSAARAGGAATAALAPFWGAAYAAISAVGSIAAIAKIKATQFGSSERTSTDTGGGNIGSFSQSGMNNGVNNTSTNLNANGTVNTPPVKVYVTQTDIHSANDTVEKIKTKALIE